MCYGWGATSNYRFKIGDFALTGTFDPKFQVEGVPSPTILLLSKLGFCYLYLLYGIKIWTDLSSVLFLITCVTDGQTDGRTDRILIAIPRLHYMQRGKNEQLEPLNFKHKVWWSVVKRAPVRSVAIRSVWYKRFVAFQIYKVWQQFIRRSTTVRSQNDTIVAENTLHCWTCCWTLSARIAG